MEKRITIPRKLLNVLLAMVLVVGFLPVCQPQTAYADDNAITLNVPYTFITSESNRWPSASFTAPADGTYMFQSTGYQGISPYGQLFSDSECVSDGLILFDTYGDNGDYFKGEYYLKKDQTVYLCVWDSNEVFGPIDVTVTPQEQKEPETLYQDWPCFAEVNGGGTVFAFESNEQNEHTFRIYAASDSTNAPVSVTGTLYSDSGLTSEIVTTTSDDNNTSSALTADLQPGTTYYLKVTPSGECPPDTYCAVVAGPTRENSFNCGDWNLKTDNTWYVDANGQLQGSATLYDSSSQAIDSEEYSLDWYQLDGISNTPTVGGSFALVALAKDDSDYASARISYVNVFEVNRLTSCQFVETNPMIVDGKLVMDKRVIWLGDNSVVDPSVYELLWWTDDGSEPKTAGTYTLLANAVEGSGWGTAQLAQDYDISEYTSRALALGQDIKVSFGDNVVLSFTPATSGFYNIAVQGVGDAGYFRVLTVADDVAYNGNAATSALCYLEADTPYYVYVDSYNSPGSTNTVNVNVSPRPCGTLMQDTPSFATLNEDEDALFAFTATSAGNYFFRTFNEYFVEIDAALYADAALTQQLATTADKTGADKQEDTDGVYLQANLAENQTVYLKITSRDDRSFLFGAVVSPVADNSITALGWDTIIQDPFYIAADGTLQGEFTLKNYGSGISLTAGTDYAISWYDVKEGAALAGDPSKAGRYAAILTGCDTYSGVRVVYTTIYAQNDLGSCRFMSESPCVINGQLVWNDALEWQGDYSLVDRSAYQFKWYDENGDLVADKDGNPSTPTKGGNYTVKAVPAEGSAWTGELAADFVLEEYTSGPSDTLNCPGSTVVSPGTDGKIYSFTPQTSGTYVVSVTSNNGLGYFRTFAFDSDGSKELLSDEVNTFVCEFQAGVTYYMSASICENNDQTVTVSFAKAMLGDANNNGRVNIVDAQVVYDMGSGKYGENFVRLQEKLSLPADVLRWIADVNKDGAIDAVDAFAIQNCVHHGGFGKE